MRRDSLTNDELEVVTALLSDASSMVRPITGRPFGTMVVTMRLQPRDGVVWLAARNIASVDSVKLVDGTEIDAVWDGLHTLAVGGAHLLRFDLDAVTPPAVDVTYTRTGAAAPEWVQALVAQMAARAFGRPADQAGVQQETIAGYSYSVGNAASSGGIGLTAQEEARLRKAFPKVMQSAWLRVAR